MESNPTNLEELFQKLKDYGDVRIELLKLKGIKKASGFTSSFITVLILIALFAAILMCLTIGASLLVGTWIGNAYFGFFIVGGVYLIIGLILFAMRDKLIKSAVASKLIESMLD